MSHFAYFKNVSDSQWLVLADASEIAAHRGSPLFVEITSEQYHNDTLQGYTCPFCSRMTNDATLTGCPNCDGERLKQ